MQRLISSILRYLIILLVFFPVLLHAQSLIPQGGGKQNQNADSLKSLISAIPLNQINNASTEAVSLYSRAGNSRLDLEEKATFTADVDSLVSESTAFLSDTVGVVFDQMNLRELESLSNTLFLIVNNLGKLQEDINRPLEDIQSDLLSLEKSRNRWKLTLEGSADEARPEAITNRINRVLRQNDSVYNLLQDDIDFLLTQSDKITSQQINLDQFSLEIEVYNTLSSERVLRRDMPAIWNSFTTQDSLEVVSQWTNFKSNFKNDSSLLATKYSNRLILLAFLFVVLFSLVFWIRSTVNLDDIKGRKLILNLYLNEIFAKPLEISLLLGLYIIRMLIPEMPETYSSMLAIITVYAVLRVAYDIFPTDYKRHLLEFAFAYVLLKLFNLFYDQYILSRMVLLATQLITLLFLFRFILHRRFSKIKKGAFIHYLLIGIAGIYMLLVVFSIVGNIVGILSFSEYLTTAIIQSTFLVLSTYVGFHVSIALVFLLMSSGLFKRSIIIKKQFNYIFGKLYGIIQMVFIISWLLMSLSFYNFKQPLFDWITEVLSREMHIGEAPFSLINIILFFFVIWLSVFISRIVRNILQEEVFTRVKVERGVPSTVIMLVRITLIIIGFLLAAAAAGMELSSLTIIIGAFSVGIGFGLQNIFNNLVSGLILAFERPIKEGDTVEVNTLLGEVKKIGIRSSIVRTVDGAEVIVPNGTLISNELINWTLSDAHRRVDIRVGVAYGTNPDKVLEILLQVAEDHPDVMMFPEPKAYFIGFGDSSLDFRMLLWVDQERRLEISSECNVRINAEIKKAGIEIPFPQRDLHVKSVDGKVIGEVKGKK